MNGVWPGCGGSINCLAWPENSPNTGHSPGSDWPKSGSSAGFVSPLGQPSIVYEPRPAKADGEGELEPRFIAAGVRPSPRRDCQPSLLHGMMRQVAAPPPGHSPRFRASVVPDP